MDKDLEGFPVDKPEAILEEKKMAVLALLNDTDLSKKALLDGGKDMDESVKRYVDLTIELTSKRLIVDLKTQIDQALDSIINLSDLTRRIALCPKEKHEELWEHVRTQVNLDILISAWLHKNNRPNTKEVFSTVKEFAEPYRDSKIVLKKAELEKDLIDHKVE